MKRRFIAALLLLLLLAGCAASPNQPEQATEAEQTETVTTETAVKETQAPASTETTAATQAAALVIQPLPDTTLENLEDSTLSVSVEQGDIYQETSGEIYLRVQIYSYDKFDMVDIAQMKEGDRIRISGKVYSVDELQSNEHGTILINGGLDEGGFDLVTDDSGFYYLQGYNDMKYWNLVCETEYLVSDGFVFTDHADLDMGEVTYNAEDLLERIPGTMFGFGPHNTSVRIENGQAVAMERIYTP